MHKIVYWEGKKVREIELIENGRYVCRPINPQKKKDRGRICTLLDFDRGGTASEGTVRWEDTGRKGKVHLSDLVPLEK